MQPTITIRIPQQLRRQLRILCQAEHLAMSDLVREALRKDVAIRQFRSLRGKMIPYAQAQGFLTDEDVFNVVS